MVTEKETKPTGEEAPVEQPSITPTIEPDNAAPVVPPVAPDSNNTDSIPRSEVDRMIREALDAQREQSEKEAANRAALEQGNYKQLYEEEQKLRRTAELNTWRGKALREFSLSDDWFDSLQGDTEALIKASAKELKRRLDKQVEDVKQQLLTNNPGTPPPHGGQHNDKTVDKGQQAAKRALAGAFGQRVK